MSAYNIARDGDPCPECGVALLSEACCWCDGAAVSAFFICEECGGRGQLLLCPNRASHFPPPPNQEVAGWNYWHGSGGNSATHSAAECERESVASHVAHGHLLGVSHCLMRQNPNETHATPPPAGPRSVRRRRCRAPAAPAPGRRPPPFSSPRSAWGASCFAETCAKNLCRPRRAAHSAPVRISR
jgi:hypothetical protein